MAARAIGSGVISFGLVSIPFKLYTAASSQNVSFNMLHKKCGGRMKQEFRCHVDNVVVERTDMVKGFEFAKDQYVHFTDDDLKKLESAKTDSLEIVEFVPMSSVDLVYIDKSYYVGPDKGCERSYSLFTHAMYEKAVVAVGKYWTRGRLQLVIIEPVMTEKSIGLVMHYMYYENEVRSLDEVGINSHQFPTQPLEIKLAFQLIGQLEASEFDAGKYRDEYQDRVRDAVDQKIAGREIVLAEDAPEPVILDLFEALKRSVKSGEKT